jgi:hypothetical protein
MRRVIIASVAAAFFMASHALHAEPMTQTFCGELWKLDDGGYQIEDVFLNDTLAKEVLTFCSVGQRCEVTGYVRHCRGVRGACIEMTEITRAPIADPDAN